jgi:hypothetical protein
MVQNYIYISGTCLAKLKWVVQQCKYCICRVSDEETCVLSLNKIKRAISTSAFYWAILQMQVVLAQTKQK